MCSNKVCAAQEVQSGRQAPLNELAHALTVLVQVHAQTIGKMDSFHTIVGQQQQQQQP
jgi:hypothetical protein